MKPEPTRYSAAYKRGVVLLLMTAYTFNAMDRNIIAIISQSMKLDLKLSDTQLGLLGGTAFAVLYAFGGIPIARLAERVSRVNIITAALIIWSALSALCGAASSFPQLLADSSRRRRRRVRLLAAGAFLDIGLLRAVAPHLGALGLFLRDIARVSAGGRGGGLCGSTLGVARGVRPGGTAGPRDRAADQSH